MTRRQPRRLPLAATALAAAALATGAAGAAGRLGASAQGASGPAPGQTPRFGLTDPTLLTDSPAKRDAALADASALGVTFIRAQLSWAATEPSPGVYDWRPFDELVEAAAAHHLSVLALVDFTPGWATPLGCARYMCAPAHPGQFAAFARAAAARYGPAGVHDWEVWNEPNSAHFWAPAANAGAYGALVKLTASAIRSVDPGATIVSG
ncbi:MAG TPA: beta-galactosidase, partial [Acidimicrobiales bacterium]|nr:beta-galactosidase [Acidimicrobiales bacterium]